MRLRAFRRPTEEARPDPPAARPPRFQFPGRSLTPRNLAAMLRHNPGLKLLSLVLAFFLWFSINVSERDAERTVEMRVSVRRVQNGLIVTNPPARPVAVRLRGPGTILDNVDENRSEFVLNLATDGPGEVRINLDRTMVRPELPARLKIVSLDPPRLRVKLERLASRAVPVRLELAGMPAMGYTVAESQVAPDTVGVTGPASKVDALKEIATEPVELQGEASSFTREVALAWAGDFVSFNPDRVRADVTLDEVMVSRDFKRVDIRVIQPEEGAVRVEPPWVTLSIRGPQRLLHNFKIPDGAVYVDASQFSGKTQRVEVRVDLPAELEVTRRQPEVHTLRRAAKRR